MAATPAHAEALAQRQRERALQRERDRLRELIEDAELEHGPVDRAAVEANRALLRDGATGSAPSPSEGIELPRSHRRPNPCACDDYGRAAAR
ncbi:hypothetical protein ACFZCL_04940 [Streptomyces sp. NPDC008159]|uniref:hypothetical protein n=1 Tax=Streptomyces sp. NPDC008159 TaxID=3364817 RepID=UPI0036ECB6C5